MSSKPTHCDLAAMHHRRPEETVATLRIRRAALRRPDLNTAVAPGTRCEASVVATEKVRVASRTWRSAPARLWRTVPRHRPVHRLRRVPRRPGRDSQPPRRTGRRDSEHRGGDSEPPGRDSEPPRPRQRTAPVPSAGTRAVRGFTWNRASDRQLTHPQHSGGGGPAPAAGRPAGWPRRSPPRSRPGTRRPPAGEESCGLVT
jgi:hypothetical protein